MTRDRIIQLMPAVGWRILYAVDPGDEISREDLELKKCWGEQPVAGFALVEEPDGFQRIESVIDFDGYLNLADDLGNERLGTLGPGEHGHPNLNKYAGMAVRRQRDRRKK